MSEENVELVRVALQAYKNPDMISALARGELDLQLVDPDVEWDASQLTEMVPDLAGVYRGHDGVRTYWRRWFEAWSHLEFDFVLRDAGEEVVVLLRNQRQWGRHTGICTELPPYAQVFTLREGKLVRWRTFPDQESALKAVGVGVVVGRKNERLAGRGVAGAGAVVGAVVSDSRRQGDTILFYWGRDRALCRPPTRAGGQYGRRPAAAAQAEDVGGSAAASRWPVVSAWRTPRSPANQ